MHVDLLKPLVHQCEDYGPSSTCKKVDTVVKEEGRSSLRSSVWQLHSMRVRFGHTRLWVGHCVVLAMDYFVAKRSRPLHHLSKKKNQNKQQQPQHSRTAGGGSPAPTGHQLPGAPTAHAPLRVPTPRQQPPPPPPVRQNAVGNGRPDNNFRLLNVCALCLPQELGPGSKEGTHGITFNGFLGELR